LGIKQDHGEGRISDTRNYQTKIRNLALILKLNGLIHRK
jgi:hypothetical protein